MDTPTALARYLAYNSGLCQVAEVGERMVGVLIGGHDGRRGFLHHVGVLQQFRRHGIGRAMVDCYLSALREQGIRRLHLLVRQNNATALRFWKAFGCKERANTVVISVVLTTSTQDSGGNE